MRGKKKLMSHASMTVAQHIQERALEGGMHAQIRLLQKEHAARFRLRDDRISRNDQTLHAITQGMDGSLRLITDLEIKNIIFTAIRMLMGGNKQNTLACEELLREKVLILNNALPLPLVWRQHPVSHIFIET